jgi:polysaccharide export outer membrane protein
MIEVNLLGRDDFRTRTRIRTDGNILLPFIGQVQASGKSASDLGRQVQSALQAGGFYANPVINVDVVSYSSRYVTVLGRVTNPGLVPIERAYRLSEIIARVGGLRDGSAGRVVLRRLSGEEQSFDIDTLATGDVNQDPLVSEGDKIYVPAAEQFFIYGEVNTPGAYAIMSEPTLRKAIAQSGGLKTSASTKRIKLFRNGQEVRGLALGDPIQPGDVVVVGERLF